MLRLLVIVCVTCALLVAADVSGTWIFDVQTDGGSGTPTFVLKQDGEKLSGTYEGMLGKAQIRGTVTGDEVVIEFDTDATGEKAVVHYAGKVEGNSKMKGTVRLGEYSGTFTARKKP